VGHTSNHANQIHIKWIYIDIYAKWTMVVKKKPLKQGPITRSLECGVNHMLASIYEPIHQNNPLSPRGKGMTPSSNNKIFHASTYFPRDRGSMKFSTRKHNLGHHKLIHMPKAST
jgi:hypothetical protein